MAWITCNADQLGLLPAVTPMWDSETGVFVFAAVKTWQVGFLDALLHPKEGTLESGSEHSVS